MSNVGLYIYLLSEFLNDVLFNFTLFIIGSVSHSSLAQHVEGK